MIQLILIALFLTACGKKSDDDFDSGYSFPPDKQNNNSPRPDPEIKNYKPSWLPPLNVWVHSLTQSKKEITDDYMRYLRGTLAAWGENITPYPPRKYLALWDAEKIEYVDKTKGKVEGMEKLESIRQAMLDRCPTLKDQKYNSPVRVVWSQTNTNDAGIYRDSHVRISNKYNKAIYWASLGSDQTQRITKIFGKNKTWNYPNQVSQDLNLSIGIDYTFVHEWGHHLARSININQGWGNFNSWMLSEFFATAVETVCTGHFLERRPDQVERWYKNMVSSFKIEEEHYEKEIKSPDEWITYELWGLEECIIHKIYHNTYNPDELLQSIILAYEIMNRQKLPADTYPVLHKEMGDLVAQAPWAAGGKAHDSIIASHVPKIGTRAEFLKSFLFIHDCGEIPNALIKAHIKGLKKFEW